MEIPLQFSHTPLESSSPACRTPSKVDIFTLYTLNINSAHVLRSRALGHSSVALKSSTTLKGNIKKRQGQPPDRSKFETLRGYVQWENYTPTVLNFNLETVESELAVEAIEGISGVFHMGMI